MKARRSNRPLPGLSVRSFTANLPQVSIRLPAGKSFVRQQEQATCRRAGRSDGRDLPHGIYRGAMGLDLLVASSGAEFEQLAATAIVRAVRAACTRAGAMPYTTEAGGVLTTPRTECRRQVTVALPTGSTPLGAYRVLTRGPQVLPWNQVIVVALDEYVGLTQADPNSFTRQLKLAIVDRLPFAGFLSIDGAAPDPAIEAARHQSAIDARGGLDVAVLGVGDNGHIAFNEPGSDIASPTRVVELDERTRQANAGRFRGIGNVPSRAITVGIEPLLGAWQVVVLVAGAAKQPALRALLDGSHDQRLPVTALGSHPHLTVVVATDASTAIPATACRDPLANPPGLS